MKISVLTCTILLVACAGIKPERAARYTDEQLCYHYFDASKNSFLGKNMPPLRNEIDRRGLISAEEWELVKARKIKLGISECALIASWGIGKVNRYVSHNENMNQHVYRLSWCSRCNVQYVYTRNGRVVAWQD